MRYISDHLGRGFTPLPVAGILSAEYYNVDSDYACYRPSGTRDWLIIFTLSGHGIIRNLNQEFSCKSGNISIFPAGIPHVYYTAEHSEWEMLWCHFNPKAEWKHLFQLTSQPGTVFQMEMENNQVSEKIESAFRRLVSYAQETYNPYWEELSFNTLNEVLYLIAFANIRNSNQFDNRVEVILHYLSEHYMEEIKIDNLAKLVCLSPSRLSHLFKHQIGESIVEILVKIRLKKSESMLKFTSRPVTEIALAVGFNSLDYYTRKFNEFFDMTPSAYRKQYTQTQKAARKLKNNTSTQRNDDRE
ncbi:helix-turn-helix domain-containing protein [Paenibacillus alba]|uniref:Helix-turn-helix domain-containing protein n=1 Tax=Paenibacillus alba TaxID=1197127 RepID=A0ABU6GDT9_9BACL|nr:helix-turn-helix domain-containing protein [Paenibacillus alba]MEC0232125.1 helix-turn-helix domain-containing protein [Paenibacillus alba]